MNTKLLTRITVMALLLGGASGWSARADDTAQLWDKNCAACHGKDGTGQTKIGQKLGIKDLTDAKVQASFTDADATKAIKEGIAKDGQTRMKAFGDKFSDDEIKALVAQVRGLKK